MKHLTHFHLERNFHLERKGTFHVYRLEGSGHTILLPQDWFPADPPAEITIEIEIRERQGSLLEMTKECG